MRRCLLCLPFLAMAAFSSANLFLINSPATYLFANGETPFFDIPVDLNANGFFAGQTVLLSRAGSYNETGGPTPTAFGLSAVFSSNNVLLPSTFLNRIPGAIAAGPGWTSPNTLIGNLSTDIAQDFHVDNMTGTANGITLVIPTGALWIFASAEDNFFSDNNNTPEFYLSIQHVVPEPATFAVLGLGALLVRRKRRVR